ncbi:MAG: XRE family transcriptional regulator [Chlorobiota bacterium]
MELQRLGQELRRLRERHDRTVTEMAQRLGISKAFLTLAEQGKRRLPLKVLRQLLAHYGSSLAALASPECTVARTVQGGRCWHPTNLLNVTADRALRGSTLRLLRPVNAPDDLEWLELRLAGEQQLPPEGYWHFSAPIDGVVVEGNLLVEVPNDELLVRQGESFRIDAEQPHRYRNYTAHPIRALLLFHRPLL